MEAHEIVAEVHDAFPNLPAKVARLKGVSAETIRSHHREPKTHNPLSSGNASPVTHYIEYIHQNESAERGAGRMLNNRVHASLNADFDSDDGHDQSELHEAILDEGCDVNKWLAKHDLNHATSRQLKTFETECDEAVEAILEAKSKARAIRRRMEASIRRVA